MEPRAGFGPATITLPSGRKATPDGDFWLNFNRFITNEYTLNYAKHLFRDAMRYEKCVANNDLSMIKTLSKDKQLGAMKALSALAKFTGCYERWKQLIKAYGLKWSVNNDDIIIARLVKYSNGNGRNNELFEWVRTVKQKIPEFAPFVDLVTATGLRLSEAIESFNIIAHGNLGEYYNAETQVLEHFKFRELFIRRTKKAFMSFVSKELIDAVRLSDLRVTKDVIDKRIQRLGLKLCFSDLRELWASYSVKNLRQPEIDFLQGRVSASVFMRNYFNPTWISDLKERTLKNASELLTLSR